MKPENPDEALLEQGLAAWDVPEPPPGLTDRILAQNAETLTALSTPANHAHVAPNKPMVFVGRLLLKHDGGGSTL